MNRPNLAILDVGHGNAAVLTDTDGVVVIDCGKGPTLIRYLKESGIKKVDVLLISHADSDHLQSAPNLLYDNEISVDRIYFNSDQSEKKGRLWQNFREALRTGELKNNLRAHTTLTTSETGDLDRGQISIEVVAPPPFLAATGPGGRDPAGGKITSNSMCAAIRLSKGPNPQVFLAGDIELDTLDRLEAEARDVTAPVLVFPHHGGSPGSSPPERMAEKICRLVKPTTILLSLHRSQYENPRPDVIATIRRVLPDTRISCTQLSSRCAVIHPAIDGHLAPVASSGREGGLCCAGSIVIDLSGPEPNFGQYAVGHQEFVKLHVIHALCKR